MIITQEKADEFTIIFNKLATLGRNELDKKSEFILALNNIIEFLAREKSSLQITVMEKLHCVMCKSRSTVLAPLTQLPCFHSVCPPCFEKQVDTILANKGDESLIKEIVCPKCEEFIPEEILHKVFPEKKLKKIIAENGIPCGLCGAKHLRRELSKLSCGHLVQLMCFRAYVAKLIDKEYVHETDLCCIDCRKPLSGYELLEVINSLPDKKANMMLDTKLMYARLKIAKPANGEKICKCPDCGLLQVIKMGEVKLVCPMCGTEVCPNCGSEPHPEIDCAELKLRSEAYENIVAATKASGGKICPSCGTPRIKLDGCHFMTCESSKCRKKKYYCNNCGMKLANRDDRSHFLFNLYRPFCKLKC